MEWIDSTRQGSLGSVMLLPWLLSWLCTAEEGLGLLVNS